MRVAEEEDDKSKQRDKQRRKIGLVRHMLTFSSRGETDAKIVNNNNGNSNNKNNEIQNNGHASATDFSPVDGSSSDINSFCKDGRKISVGDCALFEPTQDCPPFIGIIRSLTADRENKLNLHVNWLYRPAEVKLNKGSALEAAPNEIFYSFHRDEIPAASLLHPCKVAFLCRGFDLPSGISSFVCRRVYDITNKCLWWLTDQDYINERQEEVDQLLHKTRLEMHAPVQPGGRSPKPMNSPTSSQLKAGSDNVQNSGSSFGSQGKGKKRERGDQGTEPVKRERLSKTDDSESGNYRLENSLKSEIAKITDRGGLVDSEAVDKLVQLMVSEKSEKKIDLAGRSMLAGVVASTDKLDCLSRFVQLRGLPVFDEWLQEVHKGKIVDSNGAKDGEKPVDEFLLVLLRALDKLPVNLQALQMCNIGKSVNHLRTHKNMEIQRKARSLVDTWKKRVEVEMNINESKSGSNQAVSWPTRPRLSDVSHGGNRHTSGSSDVAVKSLSTQIPSSKTVSAKTIQAEAASKSASVSPGSVKSSPSPASASNNLKEDQSCAAGGGGSSDHPPAARDDKTSSPSQSHNNSQSCSADHAKIGGITSKEDARSSTAGSISVNKVSGSSSRHRKSVNGFPGSGVSGARRESGSGRSSLHRTSASEKVSHTGLTSEKSFELPVEGNSHKLIVKIPNRGRSPAHSASGGAFDDHSIMNSRASSPVPSEKHDPYDRSLKEKSDARRADVSAEVNKESCQGNNKNIVADDCVSPSAAPDQEHRRTSDEAKKLDISKSVSTGSGDDRKSSKLDDASLNSINVLIESCVKYSEANMSIPAGDEIGMNLLASVAAGEISKSEWTSPAGSPERNTPKVENSCTGDDTRAKHSGEDPACDRIQSNDGVNNKHENLEEHDGHTIAEMDMQRSAEPCKEDNGKSNETSAGDSLDVTPSSVDKINDSGCGQSREKKGFCDADGKTKANDCSLHEGKANNAIPGLEGKMRDVEGTPGPSLEIENKKNNSEVSNSGLEREQKPSASQSIKGTSEEVLTSPGSGKDMVADSIDEVKTEVDKKEAEGHSNQAEKMKTERESSAAITIESQVGAFGTVTAAATDQKAGCVPGNLDNMDGHDQCCNGPAPIKVPSTTVVQETEKCVRSKGSKLNGTDADDADECTSTTADASSVPADSGTQADAKADFDLNEGLNADEGKFVEQNNLTGAESGPPVQINPLPFPAPLSSGLPASVTVAAAAKGPFVPPDDLLRYRGELGWKGSAATSAFRPAEPRKALEMSALTNNSPVPEATSSKSSRPPLDFDLNVPDERILEDMGSKSFPQETVSASEPMKCDNGASVHGSGGLGLDLNEVVEANDISNSMGSSNRRLDVPLLPDKVASNGLPNGEGNVHRDFDLNDGPAVDEATAEPSQLYQHTKSNVPPQASVSAFRMNNTDMGNFSSWLSPGSAYSAVPIPSALPDREQPFPIVGTGGPQRMSVPPSGGMPFNADMYRGPVLSSSPAVSFASSPFPYHPMFPFGTSFPLPSATFSGGSTTYVDSSSGGRLCFPPVPSQFWGPATAVSSPFPRPFVVGLTDGSSSSGGGAESSSRKWGRQGLDLNAGPGVPELEGRDETTSPLGTRQLSVTSSQSLAEEQARMYHPGGTLKRKEPEGGWDFHKQISWQ